MEIKIGINDTPVSKTDKTRTLLENNNACQFCGFKSDKFQEVANIDNKLTPCCSFCYQTVNLFACSERRSGFLIYLPEFTQEELNHILRAIYVARTDSNNRISSGARKIFDILTSRRKIATNILGTDDPKVLAEIMKSFMTDADISKIPEKLSSIRVLSLDKKIVVEEGMEINEFPQMLNFWKTNIDFLNEPCSNWQEIKDKLTNDDKENSISLEKNIEEDING